MVLWRKATQVLILVAAIGSNPSLAENETVYVTDELYLGLYSERGGGEQLKTVVSGTPLAVLERTSRYLKVKAPDGTIGWAKAAYLVSEKPPRMRMGELEAQNSDLQQQLEQARERLDQNQRRLQPLEVEAQSARQRAERAEAALTRTRSALQSLQERHADLGITLPLRWVLATAAGALVLGFAAGIWWVDSRIRKRHGGFRIR